MNQTKFYRKILFYNSKAKIYYYFHFKAQNNLIRINIFFDIYIYICREYQSVKKRFIKIKI